MLCIFGILKDSMITSPSLSPQFLSELATLDDGVFLAGPCECSRIDQTLEGVRKEIWQNLISYSDFPEGRIDRLPFAQTCARLTGDVEQTRRALQHIMHALIGARIGSDAVDILKLTLQDHALGIKCPSAECKQVAATPKWNKQKKRKLGGIMQCTHTGTGGISVSHGVWSTIKSNLIIVPRQDKRLLPSQVNNLR